jgi:hypothetical protein
MVSSSTKATDSLLKSLEKEFALKDLGDLHYFLGIEVTKVQNGILFSQSKYAEELLQRAGMTHYKSVNTPLSTSEKCLLMLEILSVLKIPQIIEA